jgi:hypothetical protein
MILSWRSFKTTLLTHLPVMEPILRQPWEMFVLVILAFWGPCATCQTERIDVQPGALLESRLTVL